jgi:hypothetical protein
MKKFSIAFGLAVIMTSAAANAGEVSLFSVQELVALINPTALINWKVGDKADYNVGIASMGNMGTMTKSVTSGDDTTLWIEEDMSLMGQTEKVQIQMNRADGKVLKTIVNGQEQNTPDDPITVVSQDYTSITVPAGTFKVLHVLAKSASVSKIEVWANPQAIVMDGAAKQVMATQMGDVSMELTDQTKAQ